MSVHNGSRHLSEAIDSILTQTFPDFEFIVIDDGSADSTPDIVARYAELDKRIVSVRRKRKGLTKSLNEGLTLARGKFVARHDADDIALPRRLATTVAFLEANPSLAAAGTWCETVDDEGRTTGKIANPVDHDHIAWAMVGYTAIIHPSAMIRRECIADYGPYDEEYSYAQDYELWTRWIMRGARLANIPEVLVKYRRSADQISHKFYGEQSTSAVRVASVYIDFLLSDTLAQKQVLGIRQLIGPWPMDSEAVRAIPVLLRLLRLPAFRQSVRDPSTRLRLARKALSAIRKFGRADRKTALAGMLMTGRIWKRITLERGWWTCLARQISPYPYGRQ